MTKTSRVGKELSVTTTAVVCIHTGQETKQTDIIKPSG